MTNKHTPAPWHTEKQINNNITIHNETCGVVAIIPPQLYHYIANARLIAAAPELLEIIEAMVDCMDKGIACHFQTGCAMHLKMKEAINKAKGS